MRRVFYAFSFAAVVQLLGVARPLFGAVQYLGSRSTLDSQRQSVIAAIALWSAA